LQEETGRAVIDIDINSVSKHYTLSKQPALMDVSLHIRSGEWAFLVGASGTGKTTLLKLLYKEEVPDSGNVLIAGRDSGATSGSTLRRSMGIIFQTFRLLPRKTAFENIAYGAEVLGLAPALVRRRTLELLELIGLEQKAHRLPAELSGGEQQRVAVGRALINQPSLVLADEPTGNLDPENADRVLKILQSVHRERKATVLVATHAADVVDRLGQRVIRLESGKVVSDAVGGYWTGRQAVQR
jgi:cell division transport system ATP-binding protein